MITINESKRAAIDARLSALQQPAIDPALTRLAALEKLLINKGVVADGDIDTAQSVEVKDAVRM